MNVVGPASRPRLKWLDGLWFQFSARVPVQVEILSVKKRENLTLCSCLSLSFHISLTELELIEICPTVYILTYFVIWISFQTPPWMRCREYCAVPYSETPLLICGKHARHPFKELFFHRHSNLQPECWAPTVKWDEALALLLLCVLRVIWGFNCSPLE